MLSKKKLLSVFLACGLSHACATEVDFPGVSDDESTFDEPPSFEDGANDSADAPTVGPDLRRTPRGQNPLESLGTIKIARLGSRIDERGSQRTWTFNFESTTSESLLLRLNAKASGLGLNFWLHNVTNRRRPVEVHVDSTELEGGAVLESYAKSVQFVPGLYRLTVRAKNMATQEGPFAVALMGESQRNAQSDVRFVSSAPLAARCEHPVLSMDGTLLVCGHQENDDSRVGIFPDDQNQEPAAETALSGAVRIYNIVNGEAVISAYLKAPNARGGDLFGAQMALSGDGKTLAVFAPKEDGSGTGFDGNPYTETELSRDTGAIYVYRKSNHGWSLINYLKDNVRWMDELIGVSYDGNIIHTEATLFNLTTRRTHITFNGDWKQLADYARNIGRFSTSFGGFLDGNEYRLYVTARRAAPFGSTTVRNQDTLFGVVWSIVSDSKLSLYTDGLGPTAFPFASATPRDWDPLVRADWRLSAPSFHWTSPRAAAFMQSSETETSTHLVFAPNALRWLEPHALRMRRMVLCDAQNQCAPHSLTNMLMATQDLRIFLERNANGALVLTRRVD